MSDTKEIQIETKQADPVRIWAVRDYWPDYGALELSDTIFVRATLTQMQASGYRHYDPVPVIDLTEQK